jgi:Niemann-Pick C1 protein
MSIFRVNFVTFSNVFVKTVFPLFKVNLGGMMYWWHVTLNAVSLVNLVMAVGISVEFCAHITRAFAVNTQKNRVLRAKETLINMGSSVSLFLSFYSFGFNLSITEVQNICRPMLKILLKV